ncbi:acetylornithine deacetylase [Pseudomonas beijingensis]|uniref:acetylornithine deacetylase n=1 Tax=Pseudomonas beijingensis TaxID=2954101 RepID=UPI0027337658|nr:acetylornithine deacetylase [Pseudomonas sp. FP2262]WLH43612.1 acetylornithine deacetylase [Pseudomonas sp. FP2262]
MTLSLAFAQGAADACSNDGRSVLARTLEIARTLIGFPSVSDRSNLDLIEWVSGYLHGVGVQAQILPDVSGRKANLFASLGPPRPGGIILSGHTDVVPVAGQAWAQDPFSAHLDHGRLYGRGSSDMKGFIAVVLAMVPELMASARQSFHLALSYDEEVGAMGAKHLAPFITQAQLEPAGCIVGEPTSMALVIGHKGRHEINCCVHGKVAHSSLPSEGVNAIDYAARVQMQLQQVARRLAKGPLDSGFDVPYTTVQVCRVNGGVAGNVIPGQCNFDFEIRYLPGCDAEQLLVQIKEDANQAMHSEMNDRAAGASIEFFHTLHTPGLDEKGNQAFAQWVREASSMTHGRQRVAYSTEAGLFQAAGIPTIVCGPGSIKQAHKANEYVELAQLEACEQFLRRLACCEPLPPLPAGGEQ